jgi:RHS repeat-associated protein
MRFCGTDPFTDALNAATSWPFQQNRTPVTVLITTLLFLLFASIHGRRGLGVRRSPAAVTWIRRALTRLLSVEQPARSPRGFGLRQPSGALAPQTHPADSGRGLPHSKTLPRASAELSHRERRWYTQPIWRQALSVFLIVALVFTTTPTEVQAQTYDPVFYYYIQDHLGSSSIMTDRNGVVVEHYEYSAYGLSKCGGSGSAFQVSNRFTGQVLDEETGLYYYNSRYYDPGLGRFIQPDTLVPDPSDSQQLNRYTYVNNNPLKYVDPSGHEILTAIIVGVVVGAAVGAAAAAAQGARGQGIALAALAGAVGGLFGGVGFWAGGVIGGAVGGAATGTAAGAATGATVGSFVGAMAGGAAGGATGAAITGGDVAMGALTGAISAAIGFGVSQFNIHVLDRLLSDFSVSVIGGGLGGGVGAELQGGDFWEGAAYGAAGAAAGSIMAGLPAAMKALFSKWKMVDGMTGSLKLPEEIGKLVADANTTGAEHAYDADHGMHGWHASANARVANKLGPLMAPFQWLGGFAHEFFDYRGMRAEIGAQGVGRWIADSLGDIGANTLGMAAGYVLSPKHAGSIGRQIGYMVPGFSDPDPRGVGIGQRYKSN